MIILQNFFKKIKFSQCYKYICLIFFFVFYKFFTCFVCESSFLRVSGITGYQDLYPTDSIRLVGITPNEGVDDVDEDDIFIISDSRNLEVNVN